MLVLKVIINSPNWIDLIDFYFFYTLTNVHIEEKQMADILV